MGLFLIVLFALLVLATVAMVGYVIYYYLFRGLFAPTRRAMARVCYKKQNEIEVDAPGPTGPTAQITYAIDRALGRDSTVTLYHSWDYFITFEFEGKQQEFTVPEAIYANVSEGDEGLLVYKGNLFRHFIPRIEDNRTTVLPPQPR